MIVPLEVEPLTRASFAEFGEVIEVPPEGGALTNAGTARRYDAIATLDLTDGGSRPLLGVFRVRPAAFPLDIERLERHPLASQAFVPLDGRAFLVVVAPPGPLPETARTRAFLTNGRQGVNYRRGTWHHPLIALGGETDFLVVDRGDEGGNFDEREFAGGRVLRVASASV